MLDSFHLDFVLAAMIHVGQRDSIDHSGFTSKYFSTLLVSFVSIGLVLIYLFMGHTVSRLTDSQKKFFLIKVAEMKNEPCRHWLEDKRVPGNKFQRHFSLIMLLKDIFNCAVLYGLYRQSYILISLMFIFQSALVWNLFKTPPYIKKQDNLLVQITQSLYLLLNIIFMINIFGGQKISTEVRYYFIGFAMIAIVLLIIGSNIGFVLYDTISGIIKRWMKKKKNKVTQNIQSEKENNSMMSSDQSKIVVEEGSLMINQLENKSLEKREVKDKIIMKEEKDGSTEQIFSRELNPDIAEKINKIHQSKDQKELLNIKRPKTIKMKAAPKPSDSNPQEDPFKT